jgi:putative lipoic acid-binding regulatory protein
MQLLRIQRILPEINSLGTSPKGATSSSFYCPFGERMLRPFGQLNVLRIMNQTRPRGDMSTTLATVELLEKTHTFPCPYVFKAIGKAGGGFQARVIAAVREELNFAIDPPTRVREAVGGRHLSITLEPVVQSAHQVLAVYRRLETLEGIVMLF